MTVTSEDIPSSDYIGICTDGAAALTGHKRHKKGFQGEGKLLLT
jgi:hypothetical protein